LVFFRFWATSAPNLALISGKRANTGDKSRRRRDRSGQATCSIKPALIAADKCRENAAINLKNYAVSSKVSACGAEGSGSRHKTGTTPAATKQEFNPEAEQL